MKKIRTLTSPEAAKRRGLKVIETVGVVRDAAHDAGIVGPPMAGDLGYVGTPVVELEVDPLACKTAVGRVIAGSLSFVGGTVAVTVLSKTRADQTVNGHAPGTDDHARLMEIWGIEGQMPIIFKWDGWRNFASGGSDETPVEYLDSLAEAMVGKDWVNETITIVRSPRPE